MPAPIVAVTRSLPAPGVAPLLAAGFEVRHRDVDGPCPPDELHELVRGVDGVFALLSERIDEAFLDAAGPQLRVVANMAVGFDNVDVAACTARGVQVTNTPDVLTDATADLAWALILGAARRIPEADRLVRSGTWQGWRPMDLLGLTVAGKTLGILGMGKIGSAIARRATGFGMRIRYHNRTPSPEAAALGAELVDRATLFATSDVVVLAAPATPETHHVVDAAALATMRRSAILVNVARGTLVEESALVEALRAGTITAAGLDVYEFEPRLVDGLTACENTVLLPHLGSSTIEARAAMVELACGNITAVLGGRAPLTPVNDLTPRG
ncbi:MAG: D-glycerate dehydrogenase [Actinobacteria bacterium]|nr:D-glycerate dehydrogenase [Actinomycetota bacterium]